MKLFKSSIFAMMALAATLTGCTDDDNYSVGAQSPGAYFPEGLSEEVRALSTASVYEIPVYRTSADDKSQYDVTYNIYPACEGISIPSTISFSGDDLQSSLNITYDADKVDFSQVYDIVLNIADASEYGKASYTFAFQVGAPLQTVAWDGSIPGYDNNSTGSGLYTYTVFDATETHTMYKVYDENSPNSYSLIINDWFDDGLTLTIEVPDDTAVDEYGTICVRVPKVATGVDAIGDGDETMVADYAYATGNSKYENYSYYDPTAGKLYLALAWYSATSGIVAAAYDTFQLDGFPDYSISAEYKGIFIDTEGTTTAVGAFTSGADVAAVKAAFVMTSDQQTALNYVIQGGENVVDVAAGSDVRAQFPIGKSGSYILCAVSYNSKGEAQEVAYDKAVVDLSSSNEDDSDDWTVLGKGEFVDGWFLPAWNVDPTSYVSTPQFRQSKTNSKVYQVVNPYGDSSNVFAAQGINQATTKRNIEFTIDGDFVMMRPQLSGFLYSNISSLELKMFNYEGYLYDEYLEEEGEELTKDDIVSLLKANKIEASTFDDEEQMVIIPDSPFCLGDELALRAWNGVSPQESYLVLPSASQATRAKVRAKSLAAPKFAKLSSAIKAKAVKKNLKGSALRRVSKISQRYPVVRK